MRNICCQYINMAHFFCKCCCYNFVQKLRLNGSRIEWLMSMNYLFTENMDFGVIFVVSRGAELIS